jgi:uncharacterized membrane protein
MRNYSSEEKAKLRPAFLGIFAGPLLMVFGQGIVFSLDLKTVFGWVLTIIGIATLIVSMGIALDVGLSHVD